MMPDPISSLLATDNPMVTLLVTMERRLTELERRAVGAGSSLALSGFRITASGDQIIATRLSDGASRVLADFSQPA